MSRYGGESYSGVYDDYRVRRRSSSRPREESNVYYGHRRSGSGSSVSSVSDYEYRTHYSGTERPVVRMPRDVIRAPTPPPQVQRVVERAPTPEPDIVERVIVRPQPQQLIERIIERPRTPPPKIVEKEISEPAPPPIVRTRVVKVDPSPRHFTQQASQHMHQHQQPSSRDIYHRQTATPNYSYTTEYVDASNVPQVATQYAHYHQQQAQPQQYNYTVDYPQQYQLQQQQQQQYAPQQYQLVQQPQMVATQAAYPMQYHYAYRQPNAYGYQYPS